MDATINASNVTFRVSLIKSRRYLMIFTITESVAGLSINAIMVKVFITDKQFRKTTYRLLCMVMISDIIASLNSITGYIIAAYNTLDYHDGATWCAIFLTVGAASYAVSMMNLALIAIDRYFVIVRPFSPFYRYYKRNFLIISEILIWLSSIGVTMPMTVYVSSYQDTPLFCDLPNINFEKSVYLLILTLTIYVTPALLIVIAYFRIINFQRNYVRPGHRTSQQLRKDYATKRRFIWMLIWITVCSAFITWPSFGTVTAIAVTQKSISQLTSGNAVIYFLIFTGYIITLSLNILNPLIILTFDQHLRRAVWLKFGSNLYQKVIMFTSKS
ncbi:Neuropeptide FF receptor 2 [Trichoplax sp. H2]|nr:Neuropeptide FF receptor 2 [Trichoplax sp. H2]|eukprot:RDD40094.1 Neuropeptide FF receptor 2 [Trichoplax sp. H2]